MPPSLPGGFSGLGDGRAARAERSSASRSRMASRPSATAVRRSPCRAGRTDPRRAVAVDRACATRRITRRRCRSRSPTPGDSQNSRLNTAQPLPGGTSGRPGRCRRPRPAALITGWRRPGRRAAARVDRAGHRLGRRGRRRRVGARGARARARRARRRPPGAVSPAQLLDRGAEAR